MGKMIHESYPFSPMLVVSIQVIATTWSEGHEYMP
jgi:hypothetical protein